ncbi:hypothetical protein FPANT_2390, partial [Fusarium pseudoanthophilum]
ISADIADVVNCLLRLSVAIRNPAPHDRFIKSHLIDTSHYEIFDIQHVSSKFKNIEPLLAERLGKAISRRRQFFNYRLAHRAKLLQGLTHEGGDAETIASSLPEHLKDTASGQPLLIDGIGGEGSDSGFSQTSYATSLADVNQCRFPPLPKSHQRGHSNALFVTQSLLRTLEVPGNALVYLSQKPMDIKQGIPCPICAEIMRSAPQYQHHVGRHQEQLALFALPTVESDDEDEIGSESDSSAGSIVMIDGQDERGDDSKQPEEPPTSHSMPGADEKSAVPPDDLRSSRTGRQNEYFVPREGIDREVISADICRYLGNDALVRPGHYEHPETGQAIQGYYITAYKKLTTFTAIANFMDPGNRNTNHERGPPTARAEETITRYIIPDKETAH